jgi:hypothetical protein
MHIDLEMTNGEFTELLAKLACEMDTYGNWATPEFKSAFLKLALLSTPEIVESELVQFYKRVLTEGKPN